LNSKRVSVLFGAIGRPVPQVAGGPEMPSFITFISANEIPARTSTG
jgi:hypothetical protein